jgi:hypothetical protein
MESIEKIVNLIKKTGDKAIILDKNGDPNYVVMTVVDYEKLVLGKSGLSGLTEDQLLDKINRDIEIWKDSQKIEHLPIEQHNFSQELAKNDDIDMDQGFNEIPIPVSVDDFSPNLANLEEEEEDRYYFEPVE